MLASVKKKNITNIFVKCSCMPGFEGLYCDKVRFFPGCPPVNPCLNDGVCVEKPLGFKCDCKGNFSGNRCQYKTTSTSHSALSTTNEDTTKKPQCQDKKHTCLNKGICIDTIYGPYCQCLPQYSGNFCEIGNVK